MNVGLVHGRFQPFHNGHKFLVDAMLEECDTCVVLVGSATAHGEDNPFSVDLRRNMIRSVYADTRALLIGANVDFCDPYAQRTQWDVLFASCVLSLTGQLPTHVYTGKGYAVPWERVQPTVRIVERHADISATAIRKLLRNGQWNAVETLVPHEVFALLTTHARS